VAVPVATGAMVGALLHEGPSQEAGQGAWEEAQVARWFRVGKCRIAECTVRFAAAAGSLQLFIRSQLTTYHHK
jgi:hypothetical protein